jgi:hypothetical protein
MSDTSAAIHAAKEVQADSLAPELYRQSSEWFLKAKNEYKLKNFKWAREYAQKARRFAEQAEFEAIRNGGNRADQISDEVVPPPRPGYQYPAPQGTPANMYGDPETAPTGDPSQQLPVPNVQPLPQPPSN